MSNRTGFTLIELMIVVVIIGMLAAIAIPKYASTREKAYLATMKADLRNLVTAEEAFSVDSIGYTTALPPDMYTTSTGVTGPTITFSGCRRRHGSLCGTEYQAWVGSTNTARTCAIFIGTFALTPATNEGEAACT
jgi:prepilin-type N-terminal cleavage/methylation domain-containing protein